VAIPWAQAQTYNILHNFTGGLDGLQPWAGLTLDQTGNLYGTTFEGGRTGNGTVFKLSHESSSWIFSPLYNFNGGNDAHAPQARVIFGPDGTLYGTTYAGGNNGCEGVGCGAVFNLKPTPTAPPTALTPWIETVLYRFTGRADGSGPGYGDLVFDQAGNLYGTTIYGGNNQDGVVYELSPSGGGWTESVLYSFTGKQDGSNPYSGVIFDQAGNLYGTNTTGLDAYGRVYQLTPSGPPWIEHSLYGFTGGNDGAYPVGGVIFDQSGNLYGTTNSIAYGGGGTIFELKPSTGGWMFNLLYSFTGNTLQGPYSSLAMDAAGNLYGTTYGEGAYSLGSVFKLTPSVGSWIYTDLHDFSGSDGQNPVGGVVLDASGNLYGTASKGGAHGDGVVWEITP